MTVDRSDDFSALSRRLPHSIFSLESTGSCSSVQKPASDSRPLYAGRRLSSHQAPDRLVPEAPYASGFDDVWVLNDASSRGSLSFRLSVAYLPKVLP
jgi:hypothetical protein